ncbi:hypothetical protein BCR33DRAFT_783592 [Rhizoclosmatium globosum]|uniref:HECT domain-containing protein n=1 Tax=Rhizoclosmatium globosum TaxID=329046 RepID=A0A1Y2CHP5_9FUNG|nr:hypothetical protein BCR33DRAFT_783592 [Rhizoclosmatium globosum]|eukprot:ORY46437.1 hypothetical protein BCR33DRAFT_783592 [Rhizoclosmatium globosum]
MAEPQSILEWGAIGTFFSRLKVFKLRPDATDHLRSKHRIASATESATSNATPRSVSFFSESEFVVQSAAFGESHGAAVVSRRSEEGILVTWGDNSFGVCALPFVWSETVFLIGELVGQLGHNKNPSSPSRVDMLELYNIKLWLVAPASLSSSLHAGKYTHSVRTILVNSFIPVHKILNHGAPPPKVLQIACGARHSLLLTEDGSVWAFGDNSSCQLGMRLSVPFSNGATLVKELYGLPIKKICADFAGKCFVWGSGSHGQTASFAPFFTSPFPLSGMDGGNFGSVQQIACGKLHSFVLAKRPLGDGSDKECLKLYSFGCNDVGQLGNGNCISRNTVGQVLLPKPLDLSLSHSLIGAYDPNDACYVSITDIVTDYRRLCMQFGHKFPSVSLADAKAAFTLLASMKNPTWAPQIHKLLCEAYVLDPSALTEFEGVCKTHLSPESLHGFLILFENPFLTSNKDNLESVGRLADLMNDFSNEQRAVFEQWWTQPELLENFRAAEPTMSALEVLKWLWTINNRPFEDDDPLKFRHFESTLGSVVQSNAPQLSQSRNPLLLMSFKQCKDLCLPCLTYVIRMELFPLEFSVTVRARRADDTSALVEPYKNVMLPGVHSGKPVTFENREEYVKAMIQFHTGGSVESQLVEFREGFLETCGGPVLDHLLPNQLEIMLKGRGGEKANLRTWRPSVFHALPNDFKYKFLKFMTGTDTIPPIRGLKEVQIAIQPSGSDGGIAGSDQAAPVVNPVAPQTPTRGNNPMMPMLPLDGSPQSQQAQQAFARLIGMIGSPGGANLTGMPQISVIPQPGLNPSNQHFDMQDEVTDDFSDSTDSSSDIDPMDQLLDDDSEDEFVAGEPNNGGASNVVVNVGFVLDERNEGTGSNAATAMESPTGPHLTQTDEPQTRGTKRSREDEDEEEEVDEWETGVVMDESSESEAEAAPIEHDEKGKGKQPLPKKRRMGGSSPVRRVKQDNWKQSVVLDTSLNETVLVENVDEQRLPVAHTCAYVLDLPAYQTVEKLMDRLVFAVENAGEFHLV